jgi:hypothetical protein
MASFQVYLHGHHAGARAAVRTVAQQARRHTGSPLGELLTELATEIREDHEALRDVIRRLGLKPSTLRDLAASAAALAGRVALWAERPGESQALLIGLESLSLGIEGKAALWRALRAAAGSDPRLQGVDLDDLEKRAVDQRERLEPFRVEAARLSQS